MKSERRTRQVNMSLILLDGLLILEMHYKTSDTNHKLLSKFTVLLKELMNNKRTIPHQPVVLIYICFNPKTGTPP